MKKKEFKRKVDKLWKQGKKDLDKILKETSHMIKTGESHIKEMSKKAEENLEVMVLSLQREKLYYELGKSAVNLPKGKWESSKTLDSLLTKIKDINRKVKKPQK
ncbi:MAG: hypothetical protein ABIC18_02515 [Candidatus Omnitrophota bacterium]